MSSSEWFYSVFRGRIYSDDADEYGPFGNDDGADIFAHARDQSHELGPTSTVRDVLRVCKFFEDGIERMMSGTSMHGDERNIIGAGFALLRLTGQIDQEGKERVIAALRYCDKTYGDSSAYRRMIRDLKALPSARET